MIPDSDYLETMKMRMKGGLPSNTSSSITLKNNFIEKNENSAKRNQTQKIATSPSKRGEKLSMSNKSTYS